MRFNSLKKLPVLAVILALTVLLSACGRLPKPFAHKQIDPTNPLAALRGGTGMAIAPVAGVAPELAGPMAAALAVELQSLDIPAVANSDFASRYLLQGQRHALTTDSVGTTIAEIEWTLFDSDGAVVGIVNQRVRGDAEGWEAADLGLIKVVVSGAAPAISKFIAERADRTTPQIPSFIVAPIIGAPGDGALALRRALTFHLKSRGFTTVDTGHDAVFHIFANIAVTPAETRQLVEIVWRVLNKNGRELGKVRQANNVPVGALEGHWGDLAFAVAAGASEGIRRVIRSTNVSAY